jgi:DNA sulfur modification protein DndE
MSIRGIELDNIQIAARTGLVCVDAEHIKLTNLQITPMSGPVITLRDSKEIAIDKSSARTASVFLRVEGEKSKGITIKATELPLSPRAVEFDRGATEAAVIRQ